MPMILVPIQSPNGERWFVSREDSDRCFVGYSAQHKNQTHERLVARGGFAVGELDQWAPGWICRARDGTPIAELRANPVYFCGRWSGESGHDARMMDGARQVFYRQQPGSPWGLPGTSCHWLTESRVYVEMGGAGSYGYASDRIQDQSIRHYAQRDGWTLVAWWDRSGDPRHGSIAAFAMLGCFTPDEAEAKARAHFPEIFERRGRG